MYDFVRYLLFTITSNNIIFIIKAVLEETLNHRRIIRQVRDQENDPLIGPPLVSRLPSFDSTSEYSMLPNAHYSVNVDDEKKFTSEFEKNEKYIKDMLGKRQQVNNEIMHEGVDFDTFWTEHCSGNMDSAINLFYWGTVLLMIASGCFIFAQFSIGYTSLFSAVAGFLGVTASVIGWYVVDKMRKEVCH